MSRPGAELLLEGRIVALDELDEISERWRTHIAQLCLHDSRIAGTVWAATYERSEAQARSPGWACSGAQRGARSQRG